MTLFVLSTNSQNKEMQDNNFSQFPGRDFPPSTYIIRDHISGDSMIPKFSDHIREFRDGHMEETRLLTLKNIDEGIFSTRQTQINRKPSKKINLDGQTK